MKTSTITLLVLTMTVRAWAAEATPSPLDRAATPEHRAEWVQHYEDRYALEDPFSKRTDNHGLGAEYLYGTRNFRVVLKGVAYRGGANNRWHRETLRQPAPEGFNLCAEGFGRVYYLYERNFSTAPAVVQCASPRSDSHRLEYQQRSAIETDDTYDVLQTVYETIKDYRHGPVYLHCWNGWHASGLIAAKLLRQFCGYSTEEAIDYWDRNTDGHNEEARYERIRERIRDFKPYEEFSISSEETALICP